MPQIALQQFSVLEDLLPHSPPPVAGIAQPAGAMQGTHITASVATTAKPVRPPTKHPLQPMACTKILSTYRRPAITPQQRAAEAPPRTKQNSLKVFLRQRQSRPLLVPQDAGNPEPPLRLHNLHRVDAAREWLAITLRVPALVRAPHVHEVTERLDAVRDASLEKAMRLEVRIVPLHVHVRSQQNGIPLARRSIFCRRAFRANDTQPPL